MSWTRFAATVSAAVLAGWAATASAADEEFGRSGPYISAGALYAFENFSGAAEPADNSWGYQMAGGYRFNEYFALDVALDHHASFDVPGGEADVISTLLNTKFYPFHGIVQPYARIGLGWAWLDDDRGASDSGFAARFAGGIDFYVARNWALFVEAGYFMPTGGAADYSAIPLTFGVLYRFF